jgi:hypothetical protein
MMPATWMCAWRAVRELLEGGEGDDDRARCTRDAGRVEDPSCKAVRALPTRFGAPNPARESGERRVTAEVEAFQVTRSMRRNPLRAR